ncbi:hypothetical protein GGR50DRAFT_686351 [Xylaria sp. CBS 124048]|nr:hypothetical protein GGR50DRAFT_686351 [Xylaria sp. CBS 124048]
MAEIQSHDFMDEDWIPELPKTDQRPPAEPLDPPVLNPPTYGVLTKTAIESPVVRWVLPAQLRASRYNDVALIGDHSIQMLELRANTQLVPIAKRINLGATIRNCRVMGTHDYLRKTKEDHLAGKQDVVMMDASVATDTERFQQVLMLVLSSTQLVFVFMDQTPAGDWKFVMSHFPIATGKLVDPGFHMTVSPDSRYLALSCSDDAFIVHQLEPILELQRQHMNGLPIQPIRAVRLRPVRGVIQKLDFLYPNPENNSHVIMVVITSQRRSPTIGIYDWEHSEFLQRALHTEKVGCRLSASFGLPLLLIPLTVESQFLLVTEHSMGIYAHVLAGPPKYYPFQLTPRSRTAFHQGNHAPLWTAWTRPPREESYHLDADVIYLAREDGWINCVEIRADCGVERTLYMGPLQCNIDTSFGSLSTAFGDLLIAGGEFGRGIMYSLQARRLPQPVGSFPNWAPTTDMILMKEPGNNINSGHIISRQPVSAQKMPGHLLASERVFVCSGRDIAGAIVELRQGIQARLGLDISYSVPIRKCWAIPSFHGSMEGGYFLLLALPESSALLHISRDLSEVNENGQGMMPFNLSSVTLAVYVSKDVVIQVTTTHVTLVSPTSCYSHLIGDVIEDSSAILTHAAMVDGILALSVYSSAGCSIRVYTLDGFEFALKRVFEVEGEVNALSISTLSVGLCVLAGLSGNQLLSLVIYPIGSFQSEMEMSAVAETGRLEIPLTEGEDANSMGINAVTSIACLGDDKIVTGMRNGDVLTIKPADNRPPEIRKNHFGATSSHVFPWTTFDHEPSTLVCNDGGLALMKEPNAKQNPGCVEEIYRVYLCDAANPPISTPTINSLARLDGIPNYNDSAWIMIADSRILVAELQYQPSPIPRYIPIGGTLSAILYSERLDALVTVAVKGGVPSLHFIDPTTGYDLSHPIRKVQENDHERLEDVDYITHLGNPDIKIVSLLNWRYITNGRFYDWIVLLVKSKGGEGRFLIVAAEQEEAVSNTGTFRRIRFWTQFYRRTSDDPRCATSDHDGLFLNFGKTIEYHIIENKRFRTAMTYELPSPAMSLEVVNGHLHVLTSHHSLIVLDYTSTTCIIEMCMDEVHTDEVGRSGVHSIDVGPISGLGEQEQISVMSDPMCGAYGLWLPSPIRGPLDEEGQGPSASAMKLLFHADLPASIRRFVTGHTRPRWTREQPRYAFNQDVPQSQDILGLALDGSLVQFSILHEDVWRLLRFIQNLAVKMREICPIPHRYSADDVELDATSIATTKMHVDGDVLQLCLDLRALERIVSGQRQFDRFEELVKALNLTVDMSQAQVLDDTSLAYDMAYSILEYYLSPAL